MLQLCENKWQLGNGSDIGEKVISQPLTLLVKLKKLYHRQVKNSNEKKEGQQSSPKHYVSGQLTASFLRWAVNAYISIIFQRNMLKTEWEAFTFVHL